jgi:hypothetical protein
MLPCIDKVINTKARHEVYTFIDWFFWIPSNFHNIERLVQNCLCY